MRPFASGKGVTAPPLAPPFKTVLLVLLLKAVLYILVIDTIAAAWFAAPPALPTTMELLLYSEFGVIPRP